MTKTKFGDISARIAGLDWPALARDLDAIGHATTGPVLSAAECAAMTAFYADEAQFRRRVVMQNHGYGQGEYQYFAYPLPDSVATLRRALYPPLATIANRWNAALGIDGRFPNDHEVYRQHCHDRGQTRPTPLMLRYGPGDYNRLHQDVYGEEVFPMQVVFLLSCPETDFSGGAFVLTEQRPRMQSRAEVVPLARGEAVIFPVRQRPGEG